MDYSGNEGRYLEQEENIELIMGEDNLLEIASSFFKYVKVRKDEKGEIVLTLPPFEIIKEWLKLYSVTRFYYEYQKLDRL